MSNRWISVFKTFLQIRECKAYLQNGWYALTIENGHDQGGGLAVKSVASTCM